MRKPLLHVTDHKTADHYKSIAHLVDMDFKWDFPKDLKKYDGFIIHDDSTKLEKEFIPQARALGKPVVLYRVGEVRKELLDLPGVYWIKKQEHLPNDIRDIFVDE